MGAKRAVNLSVDGDLVDEARRHGANLSAVLEQALIVEVQERRHAVWRSSNRAAITAWNDWVTDNGIPFDELRPW